MSISNLFIKNYNNLYCDTLHITSTANSTSASTGSLVVDGGFGISGDIECDGLISNSITSSTNEFVNSYPSPVISVGHDALNLQHFRVNPDGPTLEYDGIFHITNTTNIINSTTGSFLVDGGVSIIKDVNIDGIINFNNTTESTSTSTGAVHIIGGVGIDDSIYIGKDCYVSRNLYCSTVTYEHQEIVESTISSTSITSGSSVVMGGMGIVKNMNIGGDVKILDTTQATSTSTGSLIISGGVAIAKDLYVDNIYANNLGGDAITISRIKQTGIFSGGVLSINTDTTKFDISAGSAYFVNYDNTRTLISWTAMSEITTSYLASNSQTWVSVYNNSGTIAVSQSSVEPTPYERRSLCILGRLFHVNRTIINKAESVHVLCFFDQLTSDISMSLGTLRNYGGNVTTGGTMTISMAACEFTRMGSNFSVLPDSPSTCSISAKAPLTFRRAYRSATVDEMTFGTPTTALDPTFYDNGTGTLVSVTSNNYTVQQVYIYPCSGNNYECYVLYGQNQYGTMPLANYNLPNFVIPPPIRGGHLLCSIIFRQDATLLSASITAGLAAIIMS